MLHCWNCRKRAELIPSAHFPYDIYWEASEDGNTLHPEKFVEDMVLGVHKKTREIEVVFRRVNNENDEFPVDIPPKKTVSTDQHTCKTVVIPDVAEVTASPDSEFVIRSEPTEPKTSIEHFHGELRRKGRQLNSNKSYEEGTFRS